MFSATWVTRGFLRQLVRRLRTDYTSGRLMLQAVGSMAELDWAQIVERVNAGTRNSHAKGKRKGRRLRTGLTLDMRRRIARVYRNQ